MKITLISGVIFLAIFCCFTPPTKPSIYVIGDSISIQYGPYLKDALSSFADYDRIRDNGQALQDLDNPVGANGGDSERVLTIIKKLKDSIGFKPNYIMVNCGLHDIKYDVKTEKHQVSINKYGQNLKELVNITYKMKVKMIWVNSTPVVDSIHNKNQAFLRFSKDIEAYNEVANVIMVKNKVPIIDLNTFSKTYIPSAYIDHVHFIKPIRQRQADFIAGSLSQIMKLTK
jgi:lysophospholipase L1-like esterase